MSELAHTPEERPAPERFFSVIVEPQTYKNLVYLLLAFPLGIAYFVVLVTGLSAGVGLAIVWVGLPILALVIMLSAGVTAFERALARGLLGTDFPPAPSRPRPEGILNQLKALLTRPSTWQGMIFQFLKFPLGIASFVAVVTLLSIALSFIAAPLLVSIPGANADINFGWNTGLSDMAEAAILSGLGVFLLPAFLHILNGFAWVQGQMAKTLLSDKGAAPTPGETSPTSRVEEPEMPERVVG